MIWGSLRPAWLLAVVDPIRNISGGPPPPQPPMIKSIGPGCGCTKSYLCAGRRSGLDRSQFLSRLTGRVQNFLNYPRWGKSEFSHRTHCSKPGHGGSRFLNQPVGWVESGIRRVGFGQEKWTHRQHCTPQPAREGYP